MAVTAGIYYCVILPVAGCVAPLTRQNRSKRWSSSVELVPIKTNPTFTHDGGSIFKPRCQYNWEAANTRVYFPIGCYQHNQI